MRSGRKRSARGRWRWGRWGAGASPRSWRTTWTASRRPRRRRHRPWCTPTSAAHATSIEVLIMLTHPTLDLLHELGLEGCAKGFKDLAANPAAATLDHAEWLGVLLAEQGTRPKPKPVERRRRR